MVVHRTDSGHHICTHLCYIWLPVTSSTPKRKCLILYDNCYDLLDFHSWKKLEPQGALIAHLSTMSTYFCFKLDSRVENLTTEWNQKQRHFRTHASWSLLWIRFVAVAFRSEEEVFLKKGPPPPQSGDLFCLALDLPLGKYGQNILMHMPGHEHFIPTKFHKHPLSRSVVKAGYVFPYIYMH